MAMPTIYFTITTLLLISTADAGGDGVKNHHIRRLLHQPLFPLDQSIAPAAISEPPFSSPSPQPQPQNQQPKYPFSTLSPPYNQNPFFPTFPSPPPPPPPPYTTYVTFPANISSLSLPASSSHSSAKPISLKLIAVIVSVTLFSAALFATSLLLLRRHRHHQFFEDYPQKTDSLRLFPPDTTPSDTDAPATTTAVDDKKPPPPSFPQHTPTSTSSEFLYLGTLVSSRDPNAGSAVTPKNDNNQPPTTVSVNYHKLGSPELRPLPPLPRQHSHQEYGKPQQKVRSYSCSEETEAGEEEGEEEFFSPRGSTGNYGSPNLNKSSPPKGFHNFKSRSSNSLNSISPTRSLTDSPSVVLNCSSPISLTSKSPDSFLNFPGPLPRFMPPPPAREPRPFSAFSPSSDDDVTTRTSSPRVSDFSGVRKVSPPPPPPPPPPRFWEGEPPSGPPDLVAPSRTVVGQHVRGGSSVKGSFENLVGVKNEEALKPKLKPLHWDKVRASSDRAMVWDQLKSSSFQLNEEMIETLFMVNGKDGTKGLSMGEVNQENYVLDPKKSQNIAILLRALNVTVDEVCEALSEGNADALGTELLESLLKMAPTKEEEWKLKEFKEESPVKLGPAEKFLKAVIDIPFAFKRVDAMLYIANFESEVEYLRRSFETLESACKELKSSRMFLKLLEAVLKTGNRMNLGTNRGDAHAFKLDTLLKLVDVKGADGKTTLLHFVVQEIIRLEGFRLSGADENQPVKNQRSALQDEIEFRKIGLQVVSGLSGELTNVKKAATMDSDVLSNDVAKLSAGFNKIREVLKLDEEIALKDNNRKFSGSVNEFLKKAEKVIINIQAQDKVALSMVKELTEYFHGNSAKEEAHPFRIFVIVRDFLSILDQVCKDVGKINERTMVNSGRQIQMVINPGLPQIFPSLSERLPSSSSSSDESSSSS